MAKRKPSTDQIQLIVVEDEPRVDSREVAFGLGVDHRSTFRLITNYQQEMEELGQLRFKIAVGDRKQGGGNPEKYVFAKGLGIQHPNVIGSIRKYQSDFEEFGQLLFETGVGYGVRRQTGSPGIMPVCHRRYVG